MGRSTSKGQQFLILEVKKIPVFLAETGMVKFNQNKDLILSGLQHHLRSRGSRW
jgi:hypothetical protein